METSVYYWKSLQNEEPPPSSETNMQSVICEMSYHCWWGVALERFLNNIKLISRGFFDLICKLWEILRRNGFAEQFFLVHIAAWGCNINLKLHFVYTEISKLITLKNVFCF